MDIKPVKRTTVTDQIIMQIGKAISTGNLAPGVKLPNERQFAEEFGTTRSRVREALRALALIGLIETKPGEGSFVSKNQDIPSETLELMFYKERMLFAEMYEARELIEPQILAVAINRIQNDEINQLENVLTSCELILREEGGRESFLNNTDTFDKIVVSSTRNSILIKLIDVFISMKRDANLRMFKVPGAMENSLKSRRKIVDAFKKKDSTELKQAIDYFFESARPFYADIE